MTCRPRDVAVTSVRRRPVSAARRGGISRRSASEGARRSRFCGESGGARACGASLCGGRRGPIGPQAAPRAATERRRAGRRPRPRNPRPARIRHRGAVALLEGGNIGARCDRPHAGNDAAQVDGVRVFLGMFAGGAHAAFGSRVSSTRRKRMRIGTRIASPKAIASPLPIEEMKLVVEIEELGDARADDFLVAVVGKAHGKECRALRQDRLVELSGALGDDAERDAVLAGLPSAMRAIGLAGRNETEVRDPRVRSGAPPRRRPACEWRLCSRARFRRPCGRAPRRRS